MVVRAATHPQLDPIPYQLEVDKGWPTSVIPGGGPPADANVRLVRQDRQGLLDGGRQDGAGRKMAGAAKLKSAREQIHKKERKRSPARAAWLAALEKNAAYIFSGSRGLRVRHPRKIDNREARCTINSQSSRSGATSPPPAPGARERAAA